MVQPIYGVNRTNFYKVVDSRTAGKIPVYNKNDSSQEVKESPVKSYKNSKTEDNLFISSVKGFLDIINPLQHIPILSSVYRFITGDDISPVSKVAGDTLYGGPARGAISLAGVAYEKATGKDIGQAFISGLSNNSKVANKDTNYDKNLERKQFVTYGANAPKLENIIWSDTPSSLVNESLVKNDMNHDKLLAEKMADALNKYKKMESNSGPQIISKLY